MKILILGATGRTGKWLVKEVLAASHEVQVLVRHAKPFEQLASKHLKIIVGLPQEPEDLRHALTGCDAVISALNISRRSDFPWSALRTPKDLLSVTMSNLISLCQQQNVSRVMIVSAWGAGDSRAEIPGWFRWFIDHSNIRFAYMDHEKQEELLRASGLNYTIVRPVGLTSGAKDQVVKVSNSGEPKPALTISRRAVARFMVAALENRYTCQTITISAL